MQIFIKNILRLFIAYSVLMGIIGAIFFFFYFKPNQKSPPKTDQPVTETPTATSSPLGQVCGGIAGIQCPTGFTCSLSGDYPDASGTCIKKTEKETIFCTLDAKICPDGSSVGRVGPKCEFSPCPTQ